MAKLDLLFAALKARNQLKNAPPTKEPDSDRKTRMRDLMKKRRRGGDPNALLELDMLSKLEGEEADIEEKLREPYPFYPSGSESMEEGRNLEALADIADTVGAIQSNTGDTISTFQDDESFGTGERLDRRNIVGDAIIGDIKGGGLSSDQEFFTSLLSDLGDDEIAKSLARNDELFKMMKEGVVTPEPEKAKKKDKKKGPAQLSSSPDFKLDPDTIKLLAATGVKDLSADALQADIIAGIGEKFRGERPSMTLTRSGAFKGTTPQVAKSLMAQKLQARRDSAKIASAQALQAQRSRLEQMRLTQKVASDRNRFLLDSAKLDRKGRGDKIKALKAGNSFIIKGLAPLLEFDKNRNVTDVLDPDTWGKGMTAVNENNDRIRILSGLKPMSEKEKEESIKLIIDAVKKEFTLPEE